MYQVGDCESEFDWAGSDGWSKIEITAIDTKTPIAKRETDRYAETRSQGRKVEWWLRQMVIGQAGDPVGIRKQLFEKNKHKWGGVKGGLGPRENPSTERGSEQRIGNGETTKGQYTIDFK
jgi:hypothetical protein